MRYAYIRVLLIILFLPVLAWGQKKTAVLVNGGLGKGNLCEFYTNLENVRNGLSEDWDIIILSGQNQPGKTAPELKQACYIKGKKKIYDLSKLKKDKGFFKVVQANKNTLTQILVDLAKKRNEKVFLYFTDHGTEDGTKLGSEPLLAKDLNTMVNKAKQVSGGYPKTLLQVVQTCHSEVQNEAVLQGTLKDGYNGGKIVDGYCSYSAARSNELETVIKNDFSHFFKIDKTKSIASTFKKAAPYYQKAEALSIPIASSDSYLLAYGRTGGFVPSQKIKSSTTLGCFPKNEALPGGMLLYLQEQLKKLECKSDLATAGLGYVLKQLKEANNQLNLINRNPQFQNLLKGLNAAWYYQGPKSINETLEYYKMKSLSGNIAVFKTLAETVTDDELDDMNLFYLYIKMNTNDTEGLKTYAKVLLGDLCNKDEGPSKFKLLETPIAQDLIRQLFPGKSKWIEETPLKYEAISNHYCEQEIWLDQKVVENYSNLKSKYLYQREDPANSKNNVIKESYKDWINTNLSLFRDLERFLDFRLLALEKLASIKRLILHGECNVLANYGALKKCENTAF